MMDFIAKDANDIASLTHFGVKGMHWGVWNEETRQRRTGSGKRSSSRGLVVSSKESKQAFKKRLERDGYSKQQIVDMSEGRDMLKKVAIGALAVAGVAAVGFIGYQAVQRYGVKTLKQGSIIQTVHSNSRPIDERIKGPFYASFTKGDNLVYANTFGRLSKDHTISRLAAKQDIKIASEARSRKVFEQMLKDNPTVSWTSSEKMHVMPFDSYLQYIGISTTGRKVDIYRNFQAGFGTNTNMDRVVGRNMFYDRLKANGFNAMMDSHNANQGGGFTRRPFIVFGDVKFDISSQSPVNLRGKAAARNKIKALLYSSGHNLANTPLYKNAELGKLAALGAGSAGLLGIQESNIRARENFIKQYKEEHPGTKKSDAQIGRMYN